MSIKEDVIKYVQVTWKKRKKKVSMRDIQKYLGLKSPSKIYAIFNGKEEIYRLAGVPIDRDDLERTRKATIEKKKKSLRGFEESGGFSYTLSENQLSRLAGIVHLEGGKDPSIVMDELLEMDLKFRKSKISFAKIRQLTQFLDLALPKKWTPKMLVDCMTGLWNQNIHTQSPELVAKLIEFIQIIKKRKWSLNDFVTYATKHHNQIYWYGKYQRGKISKKEAIRRLKTYV